MVLQYQNQSSSSPTYYYYGLPVVAALSTVLVITMVMALVGNSLVILTILRNKDMRTRTNLLLCNLALADISVAVLDIPVALYTIIRGDWHFSQSLCDFNGYLVGLGFMLSIHTLMWISIHKFISITKPFARVMTPGKIFCMMVAAWSWSLLYNVGPLVGWTDTEYKAGASQCGPVIPKTPLQLSHSLTNTIFNFIIPITVMSYCYYKIFAEVQEHMNRLQDFSDARVRTTIVQQRRISITLFIVLLCFVFCWCPYIVYSSTIVALGKENVSPIFNPLAYLAAYINSACNPIIYALRSPSFRKGFKEIICGSKRIPDWQTTLLRRNIATVKVKQHDLLYPERVQPASVLQRSMSAGIKRSSSKGNNSSITSRTLSSSNHCAESPASEQTYKWTRINGVVMSFRQTLKKRSKSSPDILSGQNVDKPVRMPKYSLSSAEPSSDRKPLRYRRNYPHLKLQIEHSEKLPPENSETFRNVPEIGGAVTEEDTHTVRRTSSSTASFALSSGTAKIKSPVIMEERHVNALPGEGSEEQSDILHSPLFEEEKYFMYFPCLIRYRSLSAPNLLMQDKPRGVYEQKPVLSVAVHDSNLLVPLATSYPRTSSEGDVHPLQNKKVMENEHRRRKLREPPHLVWKASVEKINFIPDNKNDNSNYGLYSSFDDSGGEHKICGGHVEASNAKFAISGLISSVKRSFNDLFSAHCEEMEAAGSFHKRNPSESSNKGIYDPESEVSILISSL